MYINSKVTFDSKRKLQVLSWVGGLVVTAGLLAAIIVSLRVFQDPSPFISSAWDIRWAAFYLGLTLFSGLLIWLRRDRLLIELTGAGVLAMIAIAVVRNGAGPAFILLIWWMLISAGLGNWLLSGLDLSISLLERLLVSLTLGLGGFMFIAMILGFLHLFKPIVAYSIFCLFTIIFLPKFFRSVKPDILHAFQQARMNWQNADFNLSLYALTGSMLAICALGPYLWSLAPSIRFDALTYHLAAPVAYIHAGGIFDLGTINNYWSHYAEMLYAYAMLLVGQPLPGLLHFMAGLLTTGWIFLLGRRLASRRVGLLAGLLFLSLPMVSYETGTVYVDLFVALFIVAMTTVGIIAWQKGEMRWLVVAGLFAGFALGIKLTAAPVVFVYGLFLLIALIFRFRNLLLVASYMLWMAVPALLIAAPWLIRDWVWTGNPVYPFFSGLFQNKSVPGYATVGFRESDFDFLLRVMRLPWVLMFNVRAYYHESPGAALGALPWLALPWLFPWHPGFSLRQRRRFVILFLFAIAATIFLFNINPLARYQIPLYALFAIFAALNLDAVWYFFSKSRYKAVWRALSLALLLVYLFSTRLALNVRATDFPERYPIKYFLGLENAQEFLSRSLPVYDAFQYLNQEGSGIHKVISFGNEFKLYTQSQIDGVILTHAANQLVANAKDASALAGGLASAGYDYLLVNEPEVEYSPGSYNFPVMNEDFFNGYTELVFASHRVNLYRLYAQGVPEALRSSNLLQNSGFEQSDVRGNAKFWSAFGVPKQDLSGSQAHSGMGAIEVHGPKPESSYSYIWQDVPVGPDKAYTAGYWARSDSSMSLLLQIQWLNENRDLIREDLLWRPLHEEWNWYALSSQAPRNSSYARVYASAAGDGTAWFDDLCFIQSSDCPDGRTTFVPR